MGHPEMEYPDPARVDIYIFNPARTQVEAGVGDDAGPGRDGCRARRGLKIYRPVGFADYCNDTLLCCAVLCYHNCATVYPATRPACVTPTNSLPNGGLSYEVL